MSGVSASPPPTFFSLEGRPKTRSFCCHQPLSHRKLRFNSLEIGCRGGGLQRDRVVQCNSSTNPPPPGSGTDLPLCYTEFFFLDLGVKVPCFDGFLCEFAVLWSGSLTWSIDLVFIIIIFFKLNNLVFFHLVPWEFWYKKKFWWVYWDSNEHFIGNLSGKFDFLLFYVGVLKELGVLWIWLILVWSVQRLLLWSNLLPCIML